MKTHSDDGKSSGEDNHDAAPPRHHDTVIPRYPDDMLDQVRKAVKQLGKEAATYRFTRAEKQALDEIVFTKKQQGIRTSGNEITRIAINFILWEYREYQEDSVLAQILDRLNA